jgi:hypothetical protein
MKKFLAIYLGSAKALANYRAMDDQKKKAKDKAGMEAWGKWAMDNKTISSRAALRSARPNA